MAGGTGNTGAPGSAASTMNGQTLSSMTAASGGLPANFSGGTMGSSGSAMNLSNPGYAAAVGLGGAMQSPQGGSFANALGQIGANALGQIGMAGGGLPNQPPMPQLPSQAQMEAMSPAQRQQFQMQFQAQELAAEPWRAYGTQASLGMRPYGSSTNFQNYGKPSGMIQRTPFNPMIQAQSQYAMPRQVPQFQPQLRPNMTQTAQQSPAPANNQADPYGQMFSGGSSWSNK